MFQLLLTLALLSCCIGVQSADNDMKYEVIELTADTFDDLVLMPDTDGSDRNRWLVMFTSPECPYCGRLKAEVYFALPKLKARRSSLHLGNVDATAEKILKERYHVDGYPTLYYFENGKVVEQYLMQRNENSLLKYDARTNATHAWYHAASLKDIEGYCYSSSDSRILSEDPVTFVLVTSPDSDDVSGMNDAARHVFRNIATKRRTSFFFAEVTDSEEIRNKFIRDQAPATPFVVRIERGLKNRYLKPESGLLNEETVDSWVKLNNPPTLAKLSPINYHYMTHLGKRVAMMIMAFDSKGTQRNKMALEEFDDCARRFSGPDYAYFGTLGDVDENMHPFIAQFVVDFAALPRVIVIDVETGLFYEDYEIEKQKGRCAVVQAAMSGKIPFQREGTAGFPWRGYKLFVRHFPLSLVVLVLFVLLIGFFYWVCVIGVGPDEESEAEMEKTKAEEAKVKQEQEKSANTATSQQGARSRKNRKKN